MHKSNFNFTRIFKIISIALIISFVFSQFFTAKTQAAIGINRQINFQGKLVNNPLSTNVTDTSYTVVFTLYDNSSGATALWTETQSVTTVDGIFRVALGSVTPFPANFNFNWSGLYLGIKVNADAEMTPRIQMAAVPFAFNSEKVSGLTVQDTSGNASTSGILQIANAKTINLGTQNLTFTTSGDTTLTLPTSGTVCTTANCLVSDPYWNQSSGALFANNSTVDFLFGSQASTSATFHLYGSNALAGTQPVASISANTSFAAMVIDQKGVGDIFTASKSGLPLFTVKNNGQLIIGAPYYTATCTLKTDSTGLVTCGSDNTGSGSSSPFAEITGGLIAANNSTEDFLFGSQATASATFHLYGSNALAGTQPVASIGAKTSFAAFVIDQSGLGELITSSAAGATRFTVDRSGNINTTGNASVAGSLTFRTNGGGQIQTSSNQGLTFGGNTTGNITFSPLNATGAVIIGSVTNGLAFDITNGGPTYYGTGRPAKTITLSPEYAGGTLTASGSATTTGSMTADASPSAALSNWRTYYEWSSSTATPLQDYTVVVRVKLPADFSAWAATNALTISYNTELPGVNSNKLDVIIYNADTSLSAANQSTPVVMRTANVSVSAKTWLDLSVDDSDLNDNGNALDAAGDIAVIYLKMYSMDNNHVQIGDITLSYLSKF